MRAMLWATLMVGLSGCKFGGGASKAKDVEESTPQDIPTGNDEITKRLMTIAKTDLPNLRRQSPGAADLVDRWFSLIRMNFKRQLAAQKINTAVDRSDFIYKFENLDSTLVRGEGADKVAANTPTRVMVYGLAPTSIASITSIAFLATQDVASVVFEGVGSAVAGAAGAMPLVIGAEVYADVLNIQASANGLVQAISDENSYYDQTMRIVEKADAQDLARFNQFINDAFGFYKKDLSSVPYGTLPLQILSMTSAAKQPYMDTENFIGNCKADAAQGQLRATAPDIKTVPENIVSKEVLNRTQVLGGTWIVSFLYTFATEQEAKAQNLNPDTPAVQFQYDAYVPDSFCATKNQN